MDVKRGNLSSCFCSGLETHVLACYYICVHTNTSTCTQLYVKHVKHLPVFAVKEMGGLSNPEIPAKKRREESMGKE